MSRKVYVSCICDLLQIGLKLQVIEFSHHAIRNSKYDHFKALHVYVCISFKIYQRKFSYSFKKQWWKMNVLLDERYYL